MTVPRTGDNDQEVHHPVFARFFDRLSRWMEPEVGAHRDRLLAGLTGRVIEVGAGNGINFTRYPASVEEVVAIEPEPFMRAKAERAARGAPIRVDVRPGVAASLPFPPDSFDGAVACLVLCTVPELDAALLELRRVLKPGGELRFLEHVRAPRAAKAALQRVLDRSGIWPLIGGGCHCSRPTPDSIAAAGFQTTELETLMLGPSWVVTNPHVRGVAHLSG